MTCRFRVKDLKRSLDFYTRILGFTVIDKLDFAEAKFSLVFLGQVKDLNEIPDDPTDRVSCNRNLRTLQVLPL